MSDPLDTVVLCDSPEQVWPVLFGINQTLPVAQRKLFATVLKLWTLQGHTNEQLHSMVRGKTVRQLLSEYGSVPLPKPLESGEKAGVKWALYAPPGSPPADSTS